MTERVIDNIIAPTRGSSKLGERRSVRYYRSHIRYPINLLSYPYNNVQYVTGPNSLEFEEPIYNNNFFLTVNNQRILIDFSDHLKLLNVEEDIPYFKFHVKENMSEYLNPFPPISFYDWKEFFYKLVKQDFQKNPRKGKIMFRSTPKGAAIERRREVHDILETHFRENRKMLLTNIVPQRRYFNDFKHTYLNVVIPGARKDMVDRSHMQCFGMGVPVVSPFLTTLLPYRAKWIPNEDYILIKDDFSDLIERIEWAKDNPNIVQEVAKNAQRKFLKYCTL